MGDIHFLLLTTFTNGLRPISNFSMYRYYAEYSCPFKLHNFPFDVQTCEMIFKMRTATKKYVELRDGGLKYKGDKNLVEFEVFNITTLPGKYIY